MSTPRLRFADFARDRPYHAALVPVRPTRKPAIRHTHADFHEIVYVTAGAGEQLSPAAATPLREGDVCLVRNSEEHTFVTATELAFVNIAFRAADWHAFAELAGTDPPAGKVAHDPVLAADFHRILRRFAGTPRRLDLLAFWAAVVPVLERDAAVDPRPAWLVRACAGMAEEENLRAGLPRLTELAAVSAGHLARTLDRFLGCTPVAYVTEQRLLLGARLLTSTAAPVGDVAQRCGFSSQAYFARLFRARFALSPREYRNRRHRAVVPVRS